MSHPLKSQTRQEIARLGGIEFDDIPGKPSPPSPPALYIPQVRNNRFLRGGLDESTYVLRAKDVVKAKHVISASEMRLRLGLDATQQLTLSLFDKDDLLEDMWGRGALMVWQLVHAKYDLIVSPSFSTYIPRPRTEFLINARRSMLYYAALSRAGASTIPRIAWQISHDARRFARWADMNPAVDFAAIDWGTYRVGLDFEEQLEGLAIFDRATSGRFRYLINGITTEARWSALIKVVPWQRLHITNSTTQGAAGALGEGVVGKSTAEKFSAGLASRRAIIENSDCACPRLD